MIERLRSIVAGDVAVTVHDRAFYTHELREFVRYRRLRIVGRGTYEEWDPPHSATLEEYGVENALLYHPDVGPAP
jgi:hypothetical protein